MPENKIQTQNVPILGKAESQTLKCTVCGYEDNPEDNKKWGNYVFYCNGEPICHACYEDLSIFLDCGFPPSKVKEYK